MLPAIIGAIGSMGAATLGSVLSNKGAQKNAAEAYARQRELTFDTPLLNVAGMKQAGLSPAMLNGGSFSAASSPAQAQIIPYNIGDPSIFASIAQSLASAAASKADAENKEESNGLIASQKKSQDLENAKTENEMNAWKSTHPDYMEYPDGTRIYANDPYREDKINNFEKLHPEFVGKADFVKVFQPQSESAFNALYANSKRDADVSLWRLQKTVNEMKLGNPGVLKAMANMDVAQYNQLVKLADELESQGLLDKELIEKAKKEENVLEVDEAIKKIELQLRKEQFRSYKNTNIGSILGKFEDEGFSFSNALKLCIALIAANASLTLHN